MTTSSNIAGPMDAVKEKAKKAAAEKVKRTAAEKVKKANAAKESVELEAAGEKLDLLVAEVEEEKDDVLILTPKVYPDYVEIDWNKVQVIEDLKIIIQKMNFRFDKTMIEADDPIRRYLKD